MAGIVGVHGIGQQLKGADTLKAEWAPALRSGLSNAGCTAGLVPDDGFEVAFYGDLFREAGAYRVGPATDIPYEASDLESAWETDLLAAWDKEVVRLQHGGAGPADGRTRSAPLGVQSMLNRLLGFEFFSQVATIGLIVGDLKQVYAYLHHDDVRAACRQRVVDAIADDTRVVVAHSLGSIVAYEALAVRGHQVELFVTLGSPLGIPGLVLPHLSPGAAEARGRWSNWAKRWVNVADDGDIVALNKQLSHEFGEVEDLRVSNEARAHDAVPYLTARETGRVLASVVGPGAAAIDG